MLARMSMPRFCLALAGSHLVPVAAMAQPQSNPDNSVMRSVVLKNGAVYRGELVELVPKAHIVLKLATGEVKRFEWGDITPAEPAEHSATTPAGVTGAANAHVHIESTDSEATLEHEKGTATISNGAGYAAVVKLWEPVCRAPCDASFNREGYFSIRGRGINPSEEFRLPSTGLLTLRVNAGHRLARAFSIAGLIVGGLGLIPALALFPIGATQCNLLSCEIPAQKMRADASARSNYIAGGICLALGLVLGSAGTAGMILSRTRVSIETN